MGKELELWQFIRARLSRGENVILLVVAESSGSSPGRAGYKMAVAAGGEMCGSIGGGVMEVNLVEMSRQALSASAASSGATLIDQVHQKNSPDASGMICSGRQTVISVLLSPDNLPDVELILTDLNRGNEPWMWISELGLKAGPDEAESQNCSLPNFERAGEIFQYTDKLGPKDHLYIVGGGHCSLALTDIFSKLDFKVNVIDDRPDLNTIAKNDLADRISLISDYNLIRHQIPEGQDVYVVVMTLGYASDKVVIKQLCDREFKYFGVLGSKAKMSTLISELKEEGLDTEWLACMRTPIGFPINSRTPEEIAVSIAAEIISVKNAMK